MNYIGVESSDIAKERVSIRVNEGGHGIPNETIERRYTDSLINLKNVVNICDKINIYDNTEMLKLVMVIANGKVIYHLEAFFLCFHTTFIKCWFFCCKDIMIICKLILRF